MSSTLQFGSPFTAIVFPFFLLIFTPHPHLLPLPSFSRHLSLSHSLFQSVTFPVSTSFMFLSPPLTHFRFQSVSLLATHSPPCPFRVPFISSISSSLPSSTTCSFFSSLLLLYLFQPPSLKSPAPITRDLPWCSCFALNMYMDILP